MTAKSRIVIVTDDASRVRREVFGGAVPAFARIVSSALDFDTIGAGDEAIGIFHARGGAVAGAWREFWARHHPRYGLSVERMTGFARWRAARGLPPHPAIFDLSGFDPAARAVAGVVHSEPSEVTP